MRFYDNTELSAYRRCPRRYFYRHILNLVPGGTSPELAFGLAWHAAMDEVWAFPKPAVFGDAFAAWNRVWQEAGYPSFQEIDEFLEQDLAPRTPGTAGEMLGCYLEKRLSWLSEEVELVSIEQPFAVPLYEDREDLWYCGRFDKVVRYNGGIWIVDHKTTTAYRKNGPFRFTFLDSFSPNSQVEGYQFAGRLLYGSEFRGVLIDAALVHKTVHDGFSLIPLERHVSLLDTWLWETRVGVDQIETDEKRVEVHGQRQGGSTLLPAFPRHTGACQDFGRTCPYVDLCKGLSDPLKEIREHGTPPGFEVEPWSPFDVNRLDRLGMSKT